MEHFELDVVTSATKRDGDTRRLLLNSVCSIGIDSDWENLGVLLQVALIEQKKVKVTKQHLDLGRHLFDYDQLEEPSRNPNIPERVFFCYFSWHRGRADLHIKQEPKFGANIFKSTSIDFLISFYFVLSILNFPFRLSWYWSMLDNSYFTLRRYLNHHRHAIASLIIKPHFWILWT